MHWCLREQMDVYGFAAEQFAHDQSENLANLIRIKYDGKAKVRDIQRGNQKKYKESRDAVAAMQTLVSLGMAKWIDPNKELELI